MKLIPAVIVPLLAVVCTFLPLPAAGAGGPEVAGPGLEASHLETNSIGTTPETAFRSLSSFCLDADENLLTCDSEARVIKVISPDGKLIRQWKLEFGPTRIRRFPADGTVYVGGQGILAKLDADGKVLKTVRSDGRNFPNAKTSGIAVTDRHVFASFGSGWSLRSTGEIVRFDREFGDPKTIARNLRGCCQRLDLAAKDGELYVAENARFRVLRMDAEGKVLAQWGRQAPREVDGFGACCNPMNITFGPEGEIYTAESGLGRVKRYTPDGKFLGLVGEVGVQRFSRAGQLAASCSNITVAVTNDGKLVYAQDVSKNLIRVLKAKQQ